MWFPARSRNWNRRDQRQDTLRAACGPCRSWARADRGCGSCRGRTGGPLAGIPAPCGVALPGVGAGRERRRVPVDAGGHMPGRSPGRRRPKPHGCEPPPLAMADPRGALAGSRWAAAGVRPRHRGVFLQPDRLLARRYQRGAWWVCFSFDRVSCFPATNWTIICRVGRILRGVATEGPTGGAGGAPVVAVRPSPFRPGGARAGDLDGSGMIELRNVEKFYETRAGRTYVLRRIDLDVAEGEFVTVMGPSGAGKSTLLSILGMLDGDWTGEYWFDGHPVH